MVLLFGISKVILWFVLKSCPVPPWGLTGFIKSKPLVVNFAPFLSTYNYCTKGSIDLVPKSIELWVAPGGKKWNFESKDKSFSPDSSGHQICNIGILLPLFEPQHHLLSSRIPILQYGYKAQVESHIESLKNGKVMSKYILLFLHEEFVILLHNREQ